MEAVNIYAPTSTPRSVVHATEDIDLISMNHVLVRILNICNVTFVVLSNLIKLKLKTFLFDCFCVFVFII